MVDVALRPRSGAVAFLNLLTALLRASWPRSGYAFFRCRGVSNMAIAPLIVDDWATERGREQR